jgi:polyferredoxin
MVAYAGFSFYCFVHALQNGVMPSVSRPPSVEGFLPIGGMMALKLWITRGSFDTAQPASIVILCGALSLSLLLRKSFCGWICPIGTASEAAWKTGNRLFGKTYTIPGYVDYFLRSIKYVVMAFFLYTIFIRMTSSDIAGFLETPYWKVIDVKMLGFFSSISVTTMVVLAVFIILSLLYKNFWCRYVCPYGALLGLLGCISPVGIGRNAGSCTGCNACTRNCPSLLPVSMKDNIRSPECTGCLTCLSCCPSKGALEVKLIGGKKIRPLLFGISVLAIFFGLILIAKSSGRWESSLSYDMLRPLIPVVPKLAHP